MIDVRKLRMLAALDRLGTVAAVADELRLTAPGISMQLRALERELGIALTERRGRRLALTPAGTLLAAHGRDVLDRVSLAEREVDALRRGAAGTYRVAAFPSAARTIVADAWSRLTAEGGGIELTLTTPEPEEALMALVEGGTDLAVVHSYSNVSRALPEGVEASDVATEPVWVAIRADDPVAGDTVDLASLERHPWVAASRHLTCYEMTERACGLAGFRPRVVAESTDFAGQLELVAAGVGVALVPDLTTATVPDGVRLARPATPLHRRTRAARRSTMRTDPGLDRVVGLLVEAAVRRIRVAPQ
ncbi:LysR family transcriptional regulator [Cellulomonas massiliensis]|uniref:LysR family transcriptional regulator n=1 Tax=Cellulomonas massiliensis TaxID=1465811 RepID=UPI0002DBA245|nr:LysR family transcriptional regulator [Cellulomonas massiliensis]